MGWPNAIKSNNNFTLGEAYATVLIGFRRIETKKCSHQTHFAFFF